MLQDGGSQFRSHFFGFDGSKGEQECVALEKATGAGFKESATLKGGYRGLDIAESMLFQPGARGSVHSSTVSYQTLPPLPSH